MKKFFKNCGKTEKKMQKWDTDWRNFLIFYYKILENPDKKIEN